MLVDLTKPIKSSFLSVERDFRMIIEKLFADYPQHAKILKRLLVINEPDCLDNTTSEVYKNAENISVSELIQKGYIRFNPKVKFYEHEEVKSYIILSMDNFITNANNPQFRDCTVYFDVICHSDCWDMGDFRERPFYIMGYIDGLLNEARLSGIGTFQFAGANELVLDENLSGYTMGFLAIHGTDDILPDDKWLNGARA